MTLLTTGQLDILFSANPCGFVTCDPGEAEALAKLVEAGLMTRDAEGIHRLTQAGHSEARVDMGLAPIEAAPGQSVPDPADPLGSR